MSGRRPGHVVEAEPHYVYLHVNEDMDVIYVGRTAHPKTRPYDASRRPWIKTETYEVLVSPAMPFDAATWMEAQIIRACRPKHNKRPGNSHVPEDWRVNRLAQAAGVTRADARIAIRTWPRDPDLFETALKAQFPETA